MDVRMDRCRVECLTKDDWMDVRRTSRMDVRMDRCRVECLTKDGWMDVRRT